MSNNPFNAPIEPTVADPAATALPQSPPGAYMTICILVLVLAIFGLIGSCFGGIGLAFMGAAEQLLEQVPDMDKGELKLQKVGIEGAKSVMIPAIISLVFGLITATMLIIGSIGGLRKTLGGVQFFRTALLVGIFYCIVRMAIQVYTYFATKAVFEAGYEALRNDPEMDAQTIDFAVTTNNVSQLVGMGFAVVLSLVLIVFYAWSRSYLGKPEVQKFLAAQQSSQ